MTSEPERTVEGNLIRSERDPAVRIELPEPARYVGTDKWVLYDIADCELHVYVETDERQTVRKLYWVQFEQFLPSLPERRYHYDSYDSPRHTDIGGLDFYVDTWIRDGSEPARADSDLEHVERLIHAAGCVLPPRMGTVRLVHLLDERKRKELMIIYAENLAADSPWPAVEPGLIERAVNALTIQTTS
jgi:hypothetical protein